MGRLAPFAVLSKKAAKSKSHSLYADNRNPKELVKSTLQDDLSSRNAAQVSSPKRLFCPRRNKGILEKGNEKQRNTNDSE